MSITTRSMTELEDPKDVLLRHINNMPGIRYRELLRFTGLSNGALAYHLSRLEKSSQIRVDREKEKRTTRYYSIDIPTQESDILRQLRNEVSRHIIKLILEHDLCTFNEIVEHLNKASSTTSWHLKRLKDAGIISVKHGGEYQMYQIVSPNLVSDILYKYKESFVDAVVNNYTNIVEEL
ncbi:MAG: winged helix-turn-helix transcriptional regulator [Candidatus Nitrosopolaris sp.]